MTDARDLTAALRKMAEEDGDELFAAHLAIEDEAVDRRDRRDRCMFTGNRNGIAIFSRDSEPSPLIRIGTREAVQIALRAIADHLEGK